MTSNAPARDSGNALMQPLSNEDLAALVPFPAEDAHKYSRGLLTVIAGSKRYPGAAVLASCAGQRMGAGYTEVITSKAATRLVLGASPSLVVRTFGAFDAASLKNLPHSGKRAICIGPGFDSQDAKQMRLVTEVLRHATCPVLVDGGGLAAFGEEQARGALAKRTSQGLATVVTPHVGEARRLATAYGVSPDEAPALAAKLANALGAVIVLKGPDTYIAGACGMYPMCEGTSALAKAGTGDVLAGMISSLLAQGLEPFEASILGSTLHARAGASAARAVTEICVAAEDLADYIPEAIRSLTC